ncbi:hypothetical protein VTK73DRAFT_6313 [Phialemonium thermophilum]|uniref:Uncharacterized protein n=1 Tax=Phialemonium thermophilum TaxID=223376 RepID=A0ABR3V0T5_9PEZI
MPSFLGLGSGWRTGHARKRSPQIFRSQGACTHLEQQPSGPPPGQAGLGNHLRVSVADLSLPVSSEHVTRNTHESASPKMGATLSVIKTLIVPALISLLIFVLLTYVVVPLR